MRALGGADLDGDESFFYFGGRLENGTGQGMKKSWKEAIHAQKDEFVHMEDPKDISVSQKSIRPARKFLSSPITYRKFYDMANKENLVNEVSKISPINLMSPQHFTYVSNAMNEFRDNPKYQASIPMLGSVFKESLITAPKELAKWNKLATQWNNQLTSLGRLVEIYNNPTW